MEEQAGHEEGKEDEEEVEDDERRWRNSSFSFSLNWLWRLFDFIIIWVKDLVISKVFPICIKNCFPSSTSGVFIKTISS